MEKTFKFGKVAYVNPKIKNNAVEITIKLEDNKDGKPCFRASGLIWNSKHTDCVGGGQCLDDIAETTLRHNYTFQRIYRLWSLYHLNDMNAGTPEQEDALKMKDPQLCWASNYAEACEYLKSIGLYEVMVDGKPYKYGHGWLHREIPLGDLQLIKLLLNS